MDSTKETTNNKKTKSRVKDNDIRERMEGGIIVRREKGIKIDVEETRERKS